MSKIEINNNHILSSIINPLTNYQELHVDVNFHIGEQPDLQTEFYTALYIKSTMLINKSGKSGDFMFNPDTKHYILVDSSNSNAQDKRRYIKVLYHVFCNTAVFSRDNQTFSICEIIT